jgi:multiple sugar transport system substrate-binding protein
MMKLRLLAAHAALLLFTLLSQSCNRGIEPNVLRFWHFWSEPAQRALMDTLIQGYLAENPDAKIHVEELSWSNGKTKLMIAFNSKTAPDVLELGSDWVPQFASSGVLLDVKSTPDLQQALHAGPAYALEPGLFGNGIFAVPWLLDTRVMFVNDSLIAAAGVEPSNSHLADWNAMMALGQKIQATGAKGIGVNGSDAHRLYKKILPYMWSNGGEPFDIKGNPTLNRPENIAAVQFYVDQLKAGVLETQKNLDDLFKRGQIGIHYSGSWLLTPLEKAPFKWHAEPVPGNNGNSGVSFGGGEYLAINANSSMREEAIRFVKYITRHDVQLRFAKAVNIFPADTMMQKDVFYRNRSQGSVFIEQLSKARMTPMVPRWLDAEAIIEDEVSRVLYGQATAAEAMASAQRRVEALLKEP